MRYGSTARVSRRMAPLLLLATPLAFAVAGGASRSAGLPAACAAGASPAHQFFTKVLGQWVGTTVTRLDNERPVPGYFDLRITQVDQNTFQQEYTFYRIQPMTGALERSATQLYLSTIDSSGVIHQRCKGAGTVLIDLKPKNQAFEASGEGRVLGADRLEAEVKGKVAVEGLPLKLGKNGKLQKATASWSLADGMLVGATRVEMSFRAVLLTKRYRIETELRAQRGADVQLIASR